MSILSKINTPCIGICSTVYGDDICRGCKRTAKQVIDWNTYDELEKQIVFDQLGALVTRVMKDKVVIIDPKQLQQQLDAHSIRYRSEQDPLCWAYYLLRKGHDKIHKPEKYGFSIQAPYRAYSLSELFNTIDDEFLELASSS